MKGAQLKTLFTQLTLHLISLLQVILNPFHSRAHFAKYLRSLQTGRKDALTNLRIVNTILHLKSAHFLYLAYRPTTNAYERFLYFDFGEMVIPKGNVNLAASVATQTVIYFNRTLYRNVNTHLMATLQSILIECDVSFFLQPHYQNRPVCRIVQSIFKFTFNAIDLYRISVYYISIYIYCSFIAHFTEYYHQLALNPPVTIALHVLFHLLSTLSLWLMCLNLLYIFSLAFSTLFALLSMFYIKMNQIFERSRKLTRCSRVALRRIERHYIRTFTFFSQINRMYSWCFVLCLLFSVPENAYLSLTLIKGYIPHENEPFAVFCIYYLFLFIFALHFALAFPPKIIHKFSPLFLHLLATTCNQVGQFRSRLKAARLVYAFHVSHRYGFNYGNCGLVTMATFFKYVLLYIKLMIILFKLL